MTYQSPQRKPGGQKWHVSSVVARTVVHPPLRVGL